MKTKRDTYDITIAATLHSEEYEVAEACLTSLAKQEDITAQVIFFDQRGLAPLKELCMKLSSKDIEITYFSIAPSPVAKVRNLALREANTRFVAFCDIDTVLDPNWAREILRTFSEFDASIVGTRITPEWPKRPSWYHKSSYILEFYSMLDLSSEPQPVPKLIEASFALDTEKLGDIAFFKEDLGRVNGKLLGGEGTELCRRALRKHHRIYYTPRTTAHHYVERSRMQLKWIWRRAYFGGMSRAILGGKVETFNSTKLSTLDYMALMLIVPAYAFGLIRGRYWTN